MQFETLLGLYGTALSNSVVPGWSGFVRPASLDRTKRFRDISIKLDEFYSHCDGIEIIREESNCSVLRACETCIGSEFNPTLSACVMQSQAECDEEVGADAEIYCYGGYDSIERLATGQQDCLIPLRDPHNCDRCR